jgi:hypothetical protein
MKSSTVEFDALLVQLADFLKTRRKERRSEARVWLRVPLKLTGTDENREEFEIHTTSENVSRSSFLCACPVAIAERSSVEVYLISARDE